VFGLAWALHDSDDTATTRPWRVRTMSSPCSARLTGSVSRAFASLAGMSMRRA
jgi:hypothetical protein